MARPPSRSPYLALLAGSEWLVGAPDHFRDAVLAHCRVTHHARGAAVIRSGAEARGLWAVVSGRLTRAVDLDDAGPCLTDVVIAGGWFGEETVLEEAGCAATFCAAGPSVVAHLPKRDLDAILAADAEGWRWLCLLVHGARKRAVERADVLAIRNARSRVAAILLRLAGAEMSPAAPVIELAQNDLAALAGMARSSLSRALAALEDAGAVSVRYRRIAVVDRERLRGFAGQ